MVNIIVAMAKNGVIGNKGKLPWHLKDDMRHFKHTTAQHPVIMGRKTFESLHFALPLRKNIVISRNPQLDLQGVELTGNLENALALAEGAEEIFIIGGGEVYEEAMPYTERMYITEIDAEVEGDTYFPEYDKSEWTLTETRRFEKSADNEYPFAINIYEKAGRVKG